MCLTAQWPQRLVQHPKRFRQRERSHVRCWNVSAGLSLIARYIKCLVYRQAFMLTWSVALQLGVMLTLALALEGGPRALALALEAQPGLQVNADTLPLFMWSIGFVGRCIPLLP